jgi:predicted NAD/FAD-binding protein
VSVTYWMNRLQPLDPAVPLFVSLNPLREPAAGRLYAEISYDHPLLDGGTLQAQRLLPDVQGRDRVWFCGAWTGYGFHEDALASGLAVAAALGSPAPWAGDAGFTGAGVSPAAANATPRALEPAAALQAAE